jgi:NAD+ synthase (glutamine-hydrolysing)
VAFVNMVGGQDELVFDGHSLVAGPDGGIIARGAQFAEDLIVVDLDVERVRHMRRRTPKARLLGTGAEAECEPATPVERVDLGELEPKKREPLATAACRLPMDRQSEIYAALVLGLRDYVSKTGFKTVALGLSGGIDSALTAAIAVDALGSSQVVGVIMPSDYSSPISAEDALALCDALEMRSVTLPIGPLQGAYRDALADAFQGTAPGIAEENVQARIRGNLTMALANKFGWLVLATGNKSELSVGYATLYGDMAGGFGVLKDVLKTSVYELARWRNAFPAVLPGVGEDDGGAPSLAEWLLGPKGPVIPIRSIEREPSAELRPNQLDTDSLPPYETLDPILAAYVEGDRSIDEIVAMGHDPEVVARVAKMVDGAEYKRRQGPVGVRITTRAFGKDRRMPIANRWLG